MEKLPERLLELRHAAAHPFGHLHGKLAAFIGIHVHTKVFKLLEQLQDLLPRGSRLNPVQKCGQIKQRVHLSNG
jgi:hypothetical protein